MNTTMTEKDSSKGSNEYESLKKEFSEKFSKLENEILLLKRDNDKNINKLENEILLLKEYKINKDKNINKLENEISLLKEDKIKSEKEYFDLSEDYRIYKIRLEKNIQNVNSLNKIFKNISFQKKNPDNMINYVSNKDNDIFY